MNYVDIGKTGVHASAIAMGCRRWANLCKNEASKLLATAIDCGINFFDHADIYGSGQAEVVFAEAFRQCNLPRDKYFLQSKCTLRKYGEHNIYDQSFRHIIQAVEGILRRLDTEYIDFLLLHRPDILADPQEIAEAFLRLKNEGKVHFLGVSNYNQAQIKQLQKEVGYHIPVNQIQVSLAHTLLFDAYFQVNMRKNSGVDGMLEYSKENNMLLQIWSPLQKDDGKTSFLGDNNYFELNQKLSAVAKKYQSTPAAISIAWLLRIPFNIQAAVGTTNAEHLRELCKAVDIYLTRDEWYSLYVAAGNSLP